MTRVKPGKRVRARGPRTRNGCATCRVRRVKCDETHPACRRCASTGRICDGYEATPSSSSALSLPSRPTERAFHISSESRSLQFFVERTIRQLSPFFPDDLWRTRVLQIAQSETGIRHALVAFSAYHECYLNDGIEDEMPFALRHYNLSIKELRDGRDPESSTHVQLVSCSIFICIELLRGNLGTAIRLFKYGRGMIHEHQQHLGATDTDDVMQLVKAFFARMAIQVAVLVGDVNPDVSLQSMPEVRPILPAPGFCFMSLSDAKDALLDLTAKHLKTDDDEMRCAEVAARLKQWSLAFDNFVYMSRSLPSGASEKRTIALLELHKRELNISLATTPLVKRGDSIDWDRYSDVFDQMVGYASVAVGQDVSKASVDEAPQFHMDIGVVPILFTLVARCRQPRIRRQAIQIMRRAQIQEGFWNSTLVAKVAQRIVDAEESGITVRTFKDVPGHRRVRTVLVSIMPEEKRATIEYGLEEGKWQEVLEW